MKKTVKTLISPLCVLSLLLSLSLLSCIGDADEDIKPKNRVFDAQYFDTVSVIYDYTGSPSEDFSALCDEIEGYLAYYHRLFDIYNEYEGIINLATLNRRAGEGEIRVAPEICELLSLSLEMYEKTGGRVNIAMGSVLSLWHDAREAARHGIKYYIPDREALLSAAQHTDPQDVRVNVADSTVSILDPDLRLDVGAVAKGYAAEKIAQLIESKGLSGYVVDLGHNLRVIGTKPGGDGWESGINAPDGEYANVKHITDSALVTSGIYERAHTVGGRSYHHIIDPDTLMPEDRYWSVSVHTDSSAVADALSTAFFNMTREEIEGVLPAFPDTEVTLIHTDGRVEIIGKK